MVAPGARFGPFLVHEPLGETAGTATFRATVAGEGTQVALAVAKAPVVPAAADRPRIEREIRALSSLDGTGVARVLRAGFEGPIPWVASELVASVRPLDSMIARSHLPDRVRLVRDAARAIGAAHARGVVHGELGPSSLVVDEKGRVRVTGVPPWWEARRPELRTDGPIYAAPEALEPRGRALTPASDVWSLALLLYAGVVGRHPFAGLGAADVIARARAGLPPLAVAQSGVLPALDAAVRRGLAFAPAARQPDGEALARELDALLAPLDDQLATVSSSKRLAPRESLKPGARLGPYEVLGLLGQGGMGQVFRAKDTRLDREVALKVLRGDREGANRGERFAREIEAASRVTHENIVRVHAGGEEQGVAFLVTDLVVGDALDAVVQRGGPMPPRRVAELGAKLASALAALHGAGVLHRDLKPANVLLDERGEPRLTDFGLAKLQGAVKLTATGQLLGTPVYAPLEQLEGRDVDERTDIYSLGALLYELVTGRPPFPADDLVSTVAAKTSLPEAPSRVREDGDPFLDGLVLRCLEPRPADRFASAEELEAACAKVLAGEKLETPRRAGLLVVLASALVLLGAVGVFLVREARAPRATTPADADAALLATVTARRESARCLRFLDVGDVISTLAPDAATRGARAAWTWHGLALLARGDVAPARSALELVEGDTGPEVSALRGGLELLGGGDPKRALPDLERAIGAGVAPPEVRLWRLRALLRRGGDRAAAGFEALDELARFAKAGVDLGPAAAELAVEAHVAAGKLDAARAALEALRAFETPPPALAWSVALFGVDEALLRGDLKAALAALEKAPPRPADLVDPGLAKRGQRIFAIMDGSIARYGAGAAQPDDERVVEAGLLLLLRAAPGEQLTPRRRELIARPIMTPGIGAPFLLQVYLADVLPEGDELLFQIAVRLTQKATVKDARIEAIARRAARKGPPAARLGARVCVVKAILFQERWDDGIAEAEAVRAEIEGAAARGELDPSEATELTAQVLFAKAVGHRRAGRAKEGLSILDGLPPVIVKILPCEIAIEKIQLLAVLQGDDAALAYGLGCLADPPSIGNRKSLAEAIWEIGERRDRIDGLERVIAALDTWHLGAEAMWDVRRSWFAFVKGDTKGALEWLSLCRRKLKLDAQYDGMEALIERGDRAVIPLYKKLAVAVYGL